MDKYIVLGIEKPVAALPIDVHQRPPSVQILLKAGPEALVLQVFHEGIIRFHAK
jgi:hypothetical protein